MMPPLDWVLVAAALVWVGCALAVQYHPRPRKPIWQPPDERWWPEWYFPSWRYVKAGLVPPAPVSRGWVSDINGPRPRPRADPRLSNPMLRFGMTAPDGLPWPSSWWDGLRPGAQDALRWNLDGSRGSPFDWASNARAIAAEESVARRLLNPGGK